MEVGFLDALAVVTLRVGQAKKPLLQGGTNDSSICYPPRFVDTIAVEHMRTLARSKRRMICSGNHGCRRRRQCHPHPIGMRENGHGRAGSLAKSYGQICAPETSMTCQ
jgi:hypothetical protein